MAKHPGPYVKRAKTHDFRVHGRIFLREWREFRQKTQEDLAEAAGVSTSTVTQIETGKMGWSPVTLRRLAKALKITPGQLLDIDPTGEEAFWSLYGRADMKEREAIHDHAKVIVKSR